MAKIHCIAIERLQRKAREALIQQTNGVFMHLIYRVSLTRDNPS